MKNIVNLIESDDGSGDLIFPIPDNILKELNWKEGDEVSLEVKNGEIFIKKKEQK